MLIIPNSYSLTPKTFQPYSCPNLQPASTKRILKSKNQKRIIFSLPSNFLNISDIRFFVHLYFCISSHSCSNPAPPTVTLKPNILMSFTQTLSQISSECKLSILRFSSVPRAKQTKPNDSPSF